MNEELIKISKDFFKQIDLTKAEMAEVKSLVQQEKYKQALEEYKNQFIEHVNILDLGDIPGFWLWKKTKPQELIQGWVATVQYGEWNNTTRYNIGLPGEVDWHKIPEDGWDTVLRDLPTMHWVGTLIDEYKKTKNTSYLKFWMGYWDDFAENWLEDHRRKLADKDFMANIRPGIQNSLPWASKSRLYFGWRLDNFFAWLQEAVSVSVKEAKEIIDSQKLANILLHIANFELPEAIRVQSGGVGTPNQYVLCAKSIMMAGLTMHDFKKAAKWRDTAVKQMNFYLEEGGYLKDGSDKEQSFNYNGSLSGAVNSFLAMTKNPPICDNAPKWVEEFEQKRNYRRRFLSVLKMPDGRLPSIGCGNNWGYSREKAVADYKNNKKSLAPLQAKIDNHILGDGSLAQPAFTSIVFPYGGFNILRDGWTSDSNYAFMKTSRPAPGHMREGGNGLVIVAKGDYLLVNSADEAYSKRGNYSNYFHSTLSQNSISVDGYSQQIHKNSLDPNFNEALPVLWHSSVKFDFTEGIFNSSYGGYNFTKNQVDEEVEIKDVCHKRQLIFLRQYGLWIVTDNVLSDNKHRFSQSWNLHPKFNEDEVKINVESGQIITKKPDVRNLDLHQFANMPLTYNKYFGINNKQQTLGWVAIEKEAGVFTPAVDVHVNWEGQGKQQVLTVINSYKETKEKLIKIKSLNNELKGITGFSGQLSDGCHLIYQTSLNQNSSFKIGKLEVKARTLLVVESTDKITGIILACNQFLVNGIKQKVKAVNFEFQIEDGNLKSIKEIKIPTKFVWEKTPNGLLPVYN